MPLYVLMNLVSKYTKHVIFIKVDIAKFSVKVGDIYSLCRNILS